MAKRGNNKPVQEQGRMPQDDEMPEQAIVQPAVVEPVKVTVTENTSIHEKSIDVPDGHVMLVSLDADGEELPGSHFFYPERSYKRFYGDESKFKVKKKAIK